MRLTLLTILAFSSAAAAAQASEDRYGPPRPHAMQLATAGGAYQGRMLTWSSRAFTPQTPEGAAPPPNPATAAPAPVARREVPPAPAPVPRQAPTVQPHPMAAAPQPAVRPEPRAIAEAATARTRTAPRTGLPDSLYSPPPPVAAPQRMAQAALPATQPTEGSHVRYYSVHRQYGLAPDAIPEPPASASNYVLIGVPNDGAKSAPADKDGDADGADKPF